MATLRTVMKELETLGTEQTRKTFVRHGADRDKMFGVRVGDLKKVLKTIKGDQQLALDLYATGNYDAMYLAGLAADGAQMTKKQLDDWAKQASWQMIAEYSVPGVAAESAHGPALAAKWIDAKKELVQAAGWATWAAIASVSADDDLDLDRYRELLDRVGDRIDDAPNRVRYTMNGFVIAVGCYVKPLLKDAKRVAKAIGKVEVDMGGTACKVPLATDYIKKVETAKRVGNKRKTAKC